jgi:hypothetical protein
MVNNEVSKPCTHRGLGSYGRESVQPTTIPEWRDRVPDYGSDVSVNMTSETDIDLDNLGREPVNYSFLLLLPGSFRNLRMATLVHSFGNRTDRRGETHGNRS